MNKEKEPKEIVESYLRRAGNKLNEAKAHLKIWHYSESISASQECIEFSIKSIFLLLDEEYRKDHRFKEEEFEVILNKIPDKLKHYEFPRIYLYSRFWSSFYTVAKYGLEKLGVGADKLFESEEAKLAIKHATKCNSAPKQKVNVTRSS